MNFFLFELFFLDFFFGEHSFLPIVFLTTFVQFFMFDLFREFLFVESFVCQNFELFWLNKYFLT